MNKASLVVGLVGAGVIYLFFKKNQQAAPEVPTSYPSNYSPAQPSQMYPFRAPVAPRIDNANQPWYAGSRAAMGGPANDLTSTVNLLGAGSSVIHSMDDIWGTMSSWFGETDEAKANLYSVDDLPSYESSVMAGDSYMASDAVGDQYGREFDDAAYWDEGMMYG